MSITRAWVCLQTPPCAGDCIAAREPDLAGIYVGTSDAYRVRIVTGKAADARVHMRPDVVDEPATNVDT